MTTVHEPERRLPPDAAAAGEDHRRFELVWLSERPDLRSAALGLLEEYMRSPDAWTEQHGVPIDLPAAFRRELALFPGAARPPRGDVVLGCTGGRPQGSGQLIPIDVDACELRRLYVRPSARGLGIGSSIRWAELQKAREIGYRWVVVTVVPTNHRVLRSNERMGFRPIAPYRPYPFPMVFLRADVDEVLSLRAFDEGEMSSSSARTTAVPHPPSTDA